MSKIALTPNASGTGIFTIAAPDSNTNRTLTLPDAAGEVLTDAQNDPAKLFRRDNILGTVTESSGVPTGAIIESGSNANGEFVKYADGTMICTILLSPATSTTWTFPIAFSSAPNVQATNAVGNLPRGCTVSVSSATSVVVYRWVVSTGSTSGTGAYAIATGRWF
jgi:hypothetical protein